ncbi:MAG: VOC family protein [Chloroflexi bacterium]|nr:MAG: VOC family protein [Chloroflexota bacterium]
MIDKIHHIGIAVRSLDEALEFYRDTFGLHLHAQDTIEDQGVKAALLTIGQSEIELLEPTRPDSAVGRFLERVDGELEALKQKGVELVDQHPRRGIAGLICFLHPKASKGVLVELATPID